MKKLCRLLLATLGLLLMAGCQPKAIAEDEARDFIAEFMASRIELEAAFTDVEEGWTDQTVIKELVPYHDEGEVVGYIAQMETDGADDGYVVVKRDGDTLEASEFGYKSTYYLFTLDTYLENIKDGILLGSGLRGYAIQKEDGTLIDPTTGETMR